MDGPHQCTKCPDRGTTYSVPREPPASTGGGRKNAVQNAVHFRHPTQQIQKNHGGHGEHGKRQTRSAQMMFSTHKDSASETSNEFPVFPVPPVVLSFRRREFAASCPRRASG